MVDLSTTTPLRALETGQLLPFPMKSNTVPQAFVVMTYALRDLVDDYQAEANALSCDMGETPDPDAITHSHATLDAIAQQVIALEPAAPSDRSLQMAALMVRLSIAMEAPYDQQAIVEMVSDARQHLLLRLDERDAAMVNSLLLMCFVLLDHLTEQVKADEWQPEDEADCLEWDADLLAAF
jgi:hypothetical protein